MRGLKLAAFSLFCAFFSLPNAYGGTEELVICRAINHPTHLSASRKLPALYQKIGLTIEFADYPTKRSLHKTEMGKCDGEVGRIKSVKEQTNLLQTGYPIHHVRAFAYVIKPNLKIRRWIDLKGLRIGAIRGELYAENNLKNLMANFVNNYDELETLLYERHVDVIIGLEDAFAVKDLPGDFIRSETPVFEAPLFHILHTRHKELIPLLDAQLKEMN